MDLSGIITEGHCLVDQRFADKAACLGDLARRAGVALHRDAAPILEALRHRETLGSTGLGAGIALPHARLAGLSRPFALITRLREPIAFEAVDERPVDIICLALLPGTKDGDQLNVLAGLARRLRDPAIVTAVRKAKHPRTLHALFNDP